MNWLAELIIAAAGIAGNALVFAYMLGRKTAKFEASIASLVKDVRDHDKRLDESEGKFERHEGKLIRLTVSGAQLATALAMKLQNPHADEVLLKIAESYERIHSGGANGPAS